MNITHKQDNFSLPKKGSYDGNDKKYENNKMIKTGMTKITEIAKIIIFPNPEF